MLVKSPILHLEVLAADGTRTAEQVVFCRLKRESVRAEQCCQCVHCDAIDGALTPVVACTIPVLPIEAHDPRGERTEVGGLLCQGTLVVESRVALGQVLDLLRQSDRRSVAIVDSQHVMIGMVHESGRPSPLRQLRESEVSTIMTKGIAVDECTPVRAALRLLAAHHLREATVISKRGVPIGLFRDVDGLHWLAASARNSE